MISVDYAGAVEEILQVVNDTVARLAGDLPDADELMKEAYITIGSAVLKSIQRNYKKKSDGEVGEYGVPWPPLSPYTIARRKIRPIDYKDPKIKDFSARKTKIKAVLKKRLLASLPPVEAETRAEKLARGQALREMGTNLISLLGSRSVKMLIDTKRLYESLEIRIRSEDGPFTAVDFKTGDQILEFRDGVITVGTDVEYAAAHNEGRPFRKPPLPQREFIPENPPQAWLDEWTEAAAKAIANTIKRRLQNGS